MKMLKIATIFAPILLLAGCAATGDSTANTALGGLSSLGGLAGLGGMSSGSATSTTNTATGVGTGIFKAAINQRCHSELQNNNYWKIASLAMAADKQTQVADNVCSCVTDKAPQSVTVSDMATAALDPNARSQIVGKAVASTIQACYGEVAK